MVVWFVIVGRRLIKLSKSTGEYWWASMIRFWFWIGVML
jgi:hypothetical protein